MKVKNLNIYSERLTACREAKGLTQEELARLIAVSKDNVKKWEKGTQNVNGLNLKKLADVLEVTEEYLAGWTYVNEYVKTSNSELFNEGCIIVLDVSTVKEILKGLMDERNLSEDEHIVVDHAMAIIEMTLKEKEE